MFGLEFSPDAIVNLAVAAVIGGLFAGAVSFVVARRAFRRSLRVMGRLANNSEGYFEMTARFMENFARELFRELGLLEELELGWTKDENGRISDYSIRLKVGPSMARQELSRPGAPGAATEAVS